MKKIIAISGSLRKDSFNTNLLKAIQEMNIEGVEVELVDIAAIPLYNQDLEVSFPEAAQNLKDKIQKADGIIIATPEYNRSIPGVLKNTIDWVSRPYGKNSFQGKPTLILGASVGTIGTAVAQSHLKQVMLYLDAKVIGQPELYIAVAQDKINAEGKVTDESTLEHLKNAVKVLIG